VQTSFLLSLPYSFFLPLSLTFLSLSFLFQQLLFFLLSWRHHHHLISSISFFFFFLISDLPISFSSFFCLLHGLFSFGFFLYGLGKRKIWSLEAAAHGGFNGEHRRRGGKEEQQRTELVAARAGHDKIAARAWTTT
jgi:hypothetical protein